MQSESNFANNNAITGFLLQYNKISAFYITISMLLIIHKDVSEKIMSLVINTNYMLWWNHLNNYMNKMFMCIRQLPAIALAL